MFYEDFFVPIPLFALNFHGGKGREKHERKDPSSRFRVVVGGRAFGHSCSFCKRGEASSHDLILSIWVFP